MAIQRIKRGDREEWLALRKKYIGGSDAASVIGLNEYQSPYALWCEKTGITPGFEGNLRTRIGTEMEPIIAKLFEEETGKKVQNCNFSLVNDLYPWALADVDRMVIGEDALLEIKSTSALNLKHYKMGDYPARFYCQVQHYLAVTGKQKAYLAVLIGNSYFKIFEIERDEDEIAALMDAEKQFYEYMTANTPPPIDGSESTREAIQAQQTDASTEEPEPSIGIKVRSRDRTRRKCRRLTRRCITANYNELTVSYGSLHSSGTSGRVHKLTVDIKLQRRTVIGAHQMQPLLGPHLITRTVAICFAHIGVQIHLPI